MSGFTSTSAFDKAKDQEPVKISAEAAVVWTSYRLFSDIDPLLV